ncbi:hypothetical protein D918_06398 [Trichuris suis]|nr:hypothetical protein D918_06398 [Trichuris suis]
MDAVVICMIKPQLNLQADLLFLPMDEDTSCDHFELGLQRSVIFPSVNIDYIVHTYHLTNAKINNNICKVFGYRFSDKQ